MLEMPDLKVLIDKTRGCYISLVNLETFNDKTTGNLVYNRKLKDGPGDSTYGLEVAKWIGIDKDFIMKAEKKRRRVMGESNELVSTKKSKYNSNVYVDKCKFCDSKVNLDTHHIVEQRNADEQGFVGTYHKNAPFNLIILCEQCHKKLHEIQGNDKNYTIEELINRMANVPI